MSDMAIWSGLGNAQTFERGTYFNPGSVHDVMVSRCILKESQKSGLGLIVETDILTSMATGEINGATNQAFTPLPSGMSGTWWQGMTDKNVAMPAIKGFVFALFGFESNDPRRGWLENAVPGSEAWSCNRTRRPLALIESLMTWATGETNILEGMIVHLDTRHIKTAKRGTDFTIHNWTPVNFASLGMAPVDVDSVLARCMHEPPRGMAQLPPVQPQGQPQFAPAPQFQQQPQFAPAPPAGWAPQGQNVYSPPPGPPQFAPQGPPTWAGPNRR